MAMIQRKNPMGREGATTRKIQILKEGGIHYERKDD
jgi:hypothetical protein